jgi:hypothetical protein
MPTSGDAVETRQARIKTREGAAKKFGGAFAAGTEPRLTSGDAVEAGQ